MLREAGLRVVLYNIKGFGVGFVPSARTPDELLRAYRAVVADIQRLQPDVLCLNEVSRFSIQGADGWECKDTLASLALDLGGMHHFFAHATPQVKTFGNAVLVSPGVEVLDTRCTRLEGGSVVTTSSGALKQITRSALAVHLRVAGVQFAVLVTHLDHISAEARRQQVVSLTSHLPTLVGGLPHILMGDLNMLKRSDYSSSEWATIVERHRCQGWAAPVVAEAGLELLQRDSGYEDILETNLCQQLRQGTGETGSGQELSCHQEAAPHAVYSLATVPVHLKCTTPANEPCVRVDYAFASPSWRQVCGGTAEGSSLAQHVASFVDTSAAGSDHLPLCVDLRLPLEVAKCDELGASSTCE